MNKKIEEIMVVAETCSEENPENATIETKINVALSRGNKRSWIREALGRATYDNKIINPKTNEGYIKVGKYCWDSLDGAEKGVDSDDLAYTISKWHKVRVVGGMK